MNSPERNCSDIGCDRTGPKQSKLGQFSANYIYNTALEIILYSVLTELQLIDKNHTQQKV